MHYFANSDKDLQEMLQEIGIKNCKELLDTIPEDNFFKGEFDMDSAMSENDLMQYFNKLADKNKKMVNFAGGGSYDHYVPAAIQHILQRSEYYTAYTPYQPEVSQGTLQAIYEFQSLISKITKMDVVNASMYDGGTALAEAILMAVQVKRKNKVIVPENLNPRYFSIIETYLSDTEIEIVKLSCPDGVVDVSSLKSVLDDSTAAVILQNPNYFGLMENAPEISKAVHESRSLLIASVDLTSLSLMIAPGDYDADIVVAEGQPFGMVVNFGGPYLGVFAAKKEFIRKMPGRIIGVTEDVDGKRGFVMVIQTREQHIRREKATSNICTNSGLNALAATIYLSLLGETGFNQLGRITINNSHYLAEEICKLPGYKMKYNKPFFKEFLIETPVPASEIIEKLENENILAGIDINRFNKGEGLLIAVTEKRTKNEMDKFINSLKKEVNP